MESTAVTDPFIASIPVFSEFEGVADAANYRPLPDDWALATTDIVGSTNAISSGQYKAVNMAGASVISALLNALGRRDLPFVFGGDGAMVAFPQSAMAAARETLAATQAWVKDELGLTLRAAITPMKAIRERKLDVRVALFQASEQVSYAMFTGGGSSWAETEMKAGRNAIAAAPSGARPDLTGLSCRWNPIEARRGEIVSVIAVPAPGSRPADFQALVSDIVALAGEQERGGHPVPLEGPEVSFVTKGIDIETRAAAPAGKRFKARLGILAQIALTLLLVKLNRPLGRFNPDTYRRDVGDNSDFRKFDDGLKMTLDLDSEAFGRIEERLLRAEKAGICRFGLHRQNSALMTCIVASPLQRDHIHFIDGAQGGYAMAAANLKAKVLAA